MKFALACGGDSLNVPQVIKPLNLGAGHMGQQSIAASIDELVEGLVIEIFQVSKHTRPHVSNTCL